MNGIKMLISEIHGRSIWQILGLYVLGSWIVLQVVDVLSNTIGLPEWFPRFALALLTIGLPVVLATAVVQKGFGAARPAPAAQEGGQTPATAPSIAPAQGLLTWRNAVLGGLAAFALWGVVATAWLFFGPPTAAGSGAPLGAASRTVAVLPFASVGEDEESRVFASGIHDDVLTQLTRIDGLTVISRASVARYADTQRKMSEIAAALGVAHLLEGVVRRAGDRVRVNVQLSDALTERQVWAETYDAELTAANIFAIQSDIARHVAQELRTTLMPDVEERLAVPPTDNLEAYELYSRGQYLYRRARGDTRAGLDEAAELFKRAVDVDPGFAAAYAALADVHLQRWSDGFMSGEEALPRARDAAERALDLDATLAAAHTSLADVLNAELRFEEAERSYRRALELNPGSADAHRRFAHLLLGMGRYDELVRLLRRAVELDPLSIGYRLSLASGLWFTRDYEGGIAEARKILELEPDNRGALYSLGFASVLNGDHEQGIAALERVVEVEPGYPFGPPGLAWAYARAGRRAEAMEMLQQVEPRGQMLKESAIVLGELGNLDRAFEYLERAYAEDPGSLTYLGSDPTADALKADPRFDELLARLGVR
jgi:TolB-like protein/Tfp pilus assembly protein PilF